MEYRRLGHSGLQVSALSFGAWVTFGNQIGDDVSEALMHKAYEAGVNFFDNAEVYANGRAEEVMGRLIQKAGWSRDSFLVSSKVYWGGEKPNQTGLSRKHVIEACHAALRRFRLDYLDLYYCHRPDRNTPILETVWAMNDLIRQGKVLYWGTSEWEATAIAEAHAIAKDYRLIPPSMEQPQYNMFHRERVEKEYRRLYQQHGMGTTIWSPLASGMLTGKYNQGLPKNTRASLPELAWLKEMLTGSMAEARIETVQKLAAFAQQLGIPLPRLAIAWCLSNPNVSSVILGASKVTQLDENLKAIEDVARLTPDLLNDIESILNNKPSIPSFG